PDPEHREHGGIVVEGRQRDDPGRGVEGHEAPRRLHAVELRHAQIEEHHVRAQLAGEAHGLEPVGRLAHHLDAVVGREHGAEPLAEEGLVIGEEDADHPGTRTSSAKPWPRAVVMETWPPTSSARSRRPTRPNPPSARSLPMPSSSTRSTTLSAAAKPSSSVTWWARAWRFPLGCAPLGAAGRGGSGGGPRRRWTR